MMVLLGKYTGNISYLGECGAGWNRCYLTNIPLNYWCKG